MSNMGFEINTDTQRSKDAIANNDWFVPVSLFEFCTQFGISKSFLNETLKSKLIYACDEVNQTLLDYSSTQIKKGYNTLAEVPAQLIGGEHVKVAQYKRAVYAKAKAELIKDKIDMDRKPDAENSASKSASLSEHYEGISSKAIAKIQGIPSIGVHSI